MSWESWLTERLDEREKASLLRSTKVHDLTILDFSSNDYLGLSRHPLVVQALIDASSEGAGPRASPLVTGYTAAHASLESRIASLKGHENALLFSSGFSANLGVLSAFRNAPDLAVFSDELNHASIIDGLRLLKGRAAVHIYPHADVEALERLLAKSDAALKLVVTDGVFSMDGDLAPLPEIRALADSHGALLIVDDAHGTLVFGEKGGGVEEHFGVKADISIGTLSKAVGLLGGFAATSEKWRTLLLNEGRSYVYSTALPIPLVHASEVAIGLNDLTKLRARLWENIERLKAARPELVVGGPIVPLILGDAQSAFDAANRLRADGIGVVAIRPPTVPPGTARLRIALSASHSPADVQRLIESLPKPTPLQYPHDSTR